MNTQRKHASPGEAVQATPDEAIWSALNDASRRKILDLLRADSLTTTEICGHFDTSRFAVMKHLKVLQKAGMVVVERRSRERINHLNPLPLQSIYRRWIRPFEQVPADRLLKIKKISEGSEGK